MFYGLPIINKLKLFLFNCPQFCPLRNCLQSPNRVVFHELSLKQERQYCQLYVFTPVCHSVHGWCVCLSASWDTHPNPFPWSDTGGCLPQAPRVDNPLGSHPVDRHPPLGRHPQGRHPLGRHPPGQIQPGQTPL